MINLLAIGFPRPLNNKLFHAKKMAFHNVSCRVSLRDYVEI